MVEASDPDILPLSDKKMADKEVVANILNFFVTNYDALAIHLCYTSYLLALNPDTQEKLHLEIDKYFRNKQVRSRLLSAWVYYIIIVTSSCNDNVQYPGHYCNTL